MLRRDTSLHNLRTVILNLENGSKSWENGRSVGLSKTMDRQAVQEKGKAGGQNETLLIVFMYIETIQSLFQPSGQKKSRAERRRKTR